MSLDPPATSTGGFHDVHDVARQGTELDAQIEKFFDDVLIDDIQQTPLITIEGVLQERRERDERQTRLRSRAQEMLQVKKTLMSLANTFVAHGMSSPAG
jgi:hypothetical protein